jgi:hypothetical protein
MEAKIVDSCTNSIGNLLICICEKVVEIGSCVTTSIHRHCCYIIFTKFLISKEEMYTKGRCLFGDKLYLFDRS